MKNAVSCLIGMLVAILEIKEDRLMCSNDFGRREIKWMRELS